VKLHSYWRSTSAWRVRIVLALKNVPYEYAPVNLSPSASEQHTASYAEVNPYRQVPVLEWVQDGHVVRLGQSMAIAEYLDERYPDPPLLPGDRIVRAYVRQAVEIINSGVQPLQNLRVLTAVRRMGGDDEATRWSRGVIADGLDALETLARARAGKFSVGDDVSLADVYLVPQMYNARRFGIDLAPYMRLLAVEARAAILEPFVRAHPDRQPDAPTELDES
jgi:maleylpyruvate isomerase